MDCLLIPARGPFRGIISEKQGPGSDPSYAHLQKASHSLKRTPANLANPKSFSQHDLSQPSEAIPACEVQSKLLKGAIQGIL